MDDFYSSLSSLENEAMKRARMINENEKRTLQQINGFATDNNENAPSLPPEKKKEEKSIKKLFDFSSDSTLIIALLLIMNSEQSDPLLLLALIYILL